MRTAEGETLARRVINVYQKFGLNRKRTVQHFTAECVSRDTLYGIIRRYNDIGLVGYRKGRGRAPTIVTPEKIEEVTNYCIENPRAGFTEISAHCGISRSSSHVAARKGGVKSRVRRPAPTYSANQEERCTRAAQFILSKTAPRHNKTLVMDDETYVFLDPSQNAGKQYCKIVDGHQIDDAARFRSKNNFSPKALVWQAISENGDACEPYISTSTMNAAIYKEECLKKRLLPWLRRTCGIENALLWQDLATCHFAKDNVNFLQSKKVDFVSREQNGPKMPQVRPIERYWALCKATYAKTKAKPQNLSEFTAHWKPASDAVLANSGKQLFAHNRQKLRAVARRGPLAPLRDRNL